ncbi:MAG: hypothetical protein Q9209_004423 [Squamulea sp. 1 TL-2023]
MANQRLPDGRLVYLHCSSIFNGLNAQVRKAKKISQLLEKHKSSIKILTNEYSLPAIAVVAKDLLEKHIFESLPKAKLRYPELFQPPSETQEAERTASEAEVIRMEAEAAQDIVLTSDDEGGDEAVDPKQDGCLADTKTGQKDKTRPENTNSQQPLSQASHLLSVPRLHPVYLSFKTQHRLLTLVQRLLEESCFEFGITWVPEMMKARHWDEAESIELTQWTRRFSQFTKTLPPTAIKRTPGKSITEVLFATSSLRHSAVHRLRTSAAGILKMLIAATTFTEALNDCKRSERLSEIKTQLEASIDEIVQHQNLLERKLTEQLDDIARRRAELDALEKSSIEEMLTTDKRQRNDVGSVLETFLVGSQQVPDPGACSTPASEQGKRHAEAEGEGGDSSIVYEEGTKTETNEAQAYNQTLPDGKNLPGHNTAHQSLRLKSSDNSACQDGDTSSDEAMAKVFASTTSTFRFTGHKKKGTSAADIRFYFPAPGQLKPLENKKSPVEDPSPHPIEQSDSMASGESQNSAWDHSRTRNLSAEPQNAPGEAPLTAESRSNTLGENSSKTESRDVALVNEIVPGVTLCAEGTQPNEGPNQPQGPKAKQGSKEKDDSSSQATQEALQAEPDLDSLDWSERGTTKEQKNTQFSSNTTCDATPERNDFFRINALAPDAESPKPFSALAFRDKTDNPDSHASSWPTPSSPVSSVQSATNPEEPPKDQHSISLKILHGAITLRSSVYNGACTRTAILNEAKACCLKRAQENQNFKDFLPRKWDLAVVSLRTDGYKVNLAKYEREDLAFAVRAAGKPDIRRFTLRIFEV